MLVAEISILVTEDQWSMILEGLEAVEEGWKNVSKHAYQDAQSDNDAIQQAEEAAGGARAARQLLDRFLKIDPFPVSA